jgi:dTDP-4-dehydrorhamnose reductase
MIVLVTGGAGTLGTALKALRPDWLYPDRDRWDIVNEDWVAGPGPDCIIHAAAWTDVRGAQTAPGREQCLFVNGYGTWRVAKQGAPMVYISTEYVFDGNRGAYGEDDDLDPVNAYGFSKAVGEGVCREAPASLVIRTLFKPEPFEHKFACEDQWTTGDYVSVIAPKIVRATEAFMEGGFSRHDTIHIGTERKSTLELARRSRPNVKPILRGALGLPLPRDTSLRLEKWNEMFA